MEKSRAKEIYLRMDENERFGCKFGLYPFWIHKEYNPTMDETVELMKLAGAE